MATNKSSVALLLIASFIFSVFTVCVQVRALGLAYIEEGNQMQRHMAVLHGVAGNPWQYRIVSEYLAEALSLISHKLSVPHPTATAFISFRLIQNVIIFSLAGSYYRKLGLNTYAVLIGLSILAWGMTHSLYDSNLQFNTYTDIICYLAAGLVILGETYIWIIPITIVGAFNRETSGLIPLMLIVACWPRGGALCNKAILTGIFSLVAYAFIFVGLRYAYGPQLLLTPFGHRAGIDAIRWNFFRRVTWVELFGTMGILPLVALFSIKRCPNILRRFFWTVVPLWFLMHMVFFATQWAESRYFLVPQALVFIPAALFGVMHGDDKTA